MSHSGLVTGFGPSAPVRTKISEIGPLKMEGNYYYMPPTEAELKSEQRTQTTKTVIIDENPTQVADELKTKGFQVKVQDVPVTTPVIVSGSGKPQQKGQGWVSRIFSAFQ